MKKTLRYVTLGSALVLSLAETAQAEPNLPESRIVLHVFNRASVPARTMLHAQEVVTRVFANMGVTAVWQDSSTLRNAANESAVTIVINDRSAGEGIERSIRALGLTPGAETANDGHLAYIFYDRVTEFTERFATRSTASAEISQTLAYAILHELGHLLLPFPAHSQVGIMKESWNPNDFKKMTTGELVFSAGQIENIKTALSRRYNELVISRSNQSLARS